MSKKHEVLKTKNHEDFPLTQQKNQGSIKNVNFFASKMQAVSFEVKMCSKSINLLAT